MSEILVLVGAVTSAARLEKRLLKYGDKRARTVSTPAALGGSGCSYSVMASEDSIAYIKNMRGISVRGIYKRSAEGEYYDISR